MSYTLDIIVVSIGIIGFFQLVSILTFLVYSYIFLCMYAFTSNYINFDLVSNFSYIYMFMLKLEFLMTIMFQLISFQLIF